MHFFNLVRNPRSMSWHLSHFKFCSNALRVFWACIPFLVDCTNVKMVHKGLYNHDDLLQAW